MKRLANSLSALLVATMLAAAPASAATIVKNPGTPSDIPGLSTFATTGAMMTGLSIRAVFSGGLDETLLWSTTGVGSGGVDGSGWKLSVSGDSFDEFAWNFDFDAGGSLGQLVLLVIDGTGSLTVLDTDNPSFGTAGSAAGRNFGIELPGFDALAVGTYDNEVGVLGNAAVGDLFQRLTVTFQQGGPRDSFRFSQDTDNDSRIDVPEPGALALASLALLLALRRKP
jgi:PEP-CTERM motif